MLQTLEKDSAIDFMYWSKIAVTLTSLQPPFYYLDRGLQGWDYRTEVLQSSWCGLWPVVAFVKSVAFNWETGIEERMALKGTPLPPTKDVLWRGPNNTDMAWVNQARDAYRFQKCSQMNISTPRPPKPRGNQQTLHIGAVTSVESVCMARMCYREARDWREQIHFPAARASWKEDILLWWLELESSKENSGAPWLLLHYWFVDASPPLSIPVRSDLHCTVF